MGETQGNISDGTRQVHRRSHNSSGNPSDESRWAPEAAQSRGQRLNSCCLQEANVFIKVLPGMESF